MPLTIARSQPSKAAELAEMKVRSIEEVNRGIETIRKRFITPIVGQELIYQEKEAEAKRYLAADPEPVDLTEFPFIAAEIGATAPTAGEVAQLYLNLGAQWRVIGAQLEQVRLGTIAQIEQATTPGSVTAILALFDLTLEAFG